MWGEEEKEDPHKVAAEWFSRLHSGRCSAREEAEFLAWLDRDKCHMAVYRKCIRMWNLIGRVPLSSAFRKPKPVWQRRDVLAAVVLACAGGGFLAAGQARADTYRTAVGEQRRVSLRDGSQIFLDTDSALKFAYGFSSRNAEIVRGRVFISTASGETYPLSVKCGKWIVSTRNGDMDLYRDEARFSAFFRKGRGSVTSSDGVSRQLKAGDRLQAEGRKVLLDHPDRASMLAWELGQLIFRNATLGQAVHQMNRYSRTKLIVDDAAAAAMKISGVYKAGKCRDFARTVAMMLPVRTYEYDYTIHIAARRRR